MLNEGWIKWPQNCNILSLSQDTQFVSLYFEIKNASTGWQSQMSQDSWWKTSMSLLKLYSKDDYLLLYKILTPWDCWYVIISFVDGFRGNRSQEDAIYNTTGYWTSSQPVLIISIMWCEIWLICIYRMMAAKRPLMLKFLMLCTLTLFNHM